MDAKAGVATARESVRMFDALEASHPSYLVVSRRAIALHRLAEVEFKAGHLDDAWRWSQSALHAQRSLPPQGSEDIEQQMQLVQVLILAGKISAKSGNPERAESFFREALDRATPIARSQELTRLIPLASAEEALGAFYAGRRQKDEATVYYQKFADLWQRFPASNEYVDLQRAASGKRMASLR
jgi:tetratricopeptide (TPR) repeat protein